MFWWGLDPAFALLSGPRRPLSLSKSLHFHVLQKKLDGWIISPACQWQSISASVWLSKSHLLGQESCVCRLQTWGQADLKCKGMNGRYSPFLLLSFVTTSEHGQSTQHPALSETEKEINSRGPTLGTKIISPQCNASAGLYLLWMSSWSRGLWLQEVAFSAYARLPQTWPLGEASGAWGFHPNLGNRVLC